MQGEFPEPKTYNVQVPAGEEPSQGHVTVRLTNQYGQIFEDRFSLRYPVYLDMNHYTLLQKPSCKQHIKIKKLILLPDLIN